MKFNIMHITKFTRMIAAAATLTLVALQSCTPTAETPIREIRTLNSDTTTPLVEHLEGSPVCHVKIDFKYLQPASADDSTATVLNQELQSQAFGADYSLCSPEEAIANAVADYAENYRKDLKTAYEEAVKAGDDLESTAYMYSYEYELTSELSTVRDSIYTYAISTYEYTGGANPNTFLHWTNLNARTGKALKKADVFKSGCEDKLVSIIGTHLVPIISERLDTDALTTLQDLYDSNLLFDGPLQVPENFLITPDGIRFLYNRYEIAPYALGDLQVLVPYEEIEDWLSL